jgi:subtilisin-like proprotein convertase family protein
MDSAKSRRFAIICTVCIILALCAFLLRSQHRHEPSSSATAQGSQPPVTENPAPSQSRIEKESRKMTRAGNPVVDSEETWNFNTDGQSLAIKLALDEAAVQLADGKNSIVPLTPPATEESLPARLADLKSDGEVLPVAYVVGRERSSTSRRIVTPDLRVQLDDAAAERIAATHDLVVKSRPEYAPGWVIMGAASPFAALDAMVNLRAVREVASADVLLAVQRSLRAMPNDTLIGNQWHLKKTAASTAGTDVNIETIWNYPSATGSRGAGIRIGVVDDGMQTNHPDLVTNVDTTNDFDWNGNDSDPNPGTGDDHGTSCAGNVAAKGNNSLGVAGTAPDATLVGMRLIAAATTDLQESQAMAYLPDLVHIKSNSWGPSDTGDLLDAPGSLTLAALKNSAETGRNGKGNIFLWAGGNGGGAANDNSNYDGYANSIYTIAIGAINSSGNRSSYSEPGSNLLVCAPSSGAIGITTVDRTGANGYNSGDYTSTFGGTSSATPTAAGIVALMLEKNPNLGWRDVREILIRSAKKFKPTDSDWVTNGAGFPFNHNFGAGLIDATAAVNLANGWTNLPAHTQTTSTQSGLNVNIPNNNTTGITRSFNLSASNIRVEHVTVRVAINHSARGELAISLTSPGGMTSRLAEVHADTNPNYQNWTFSSVRNWGEASNGVWTLKIADSSSTTNTTGGTLTSAVLTVFGSSSIPVNPAPLVQITQPTGDQIFSPGTNLTVNVSASDLVGGGGPGTVSSVSLFDNDVLVGSDVSAPYSFTYSPALGSHGLVAKATDSEGAVGTSVSVNFTVANQTPVITAAALSATGQQYSDTPLTVSSITSTDPENNPVTYTYQWQSSDNQTLYTDVSGENSPTSPDLPGTLVRCVIVASDGNTSSKPFTTASVNLLARPGTSAVIGDSYEYSSGLVLRGSDASITRTAIIHEISQGPSGGTAEWIEILTLRQGSLAYWDIQDEEGNTLVFTDDAVWYDIPAGTLIVIYNGASRDPLLPADDLNPADGRMIVSSTNAACFDLELSDGWPPLGNSGDSIFLNDESSNEVHSISYGNSVATSPNVGSVGSGNSAFYAADSDAGANVASNWMVNTSLSARTSRAAGDLYISEYVEGSGFNQVIEIYNPSSASVNLDAASYKLEFHASTSATPTFTIPLTGNLAAGSTYVVKNSSASAAITAQLSSTSLRFDGNDTVVLRKGTTLVDCIGQIGNTPATSWSFNGISTRDQTLRRKFTVTQGDVNGSDTFNPSLEWDKFAIDTFNGLGSHSTIQPLTLTINPATFAENAGSFAASGTVSIPTALASPLVVTLDSPDSSEVTLPASVTIAAGQTSSPAFALAAVDDTLIDGSQTVILTASAAGFVSTTATVIVTDSEAALAGVTPGSPNSPANLTFVDNLRSGAFNAPALFRFGTGASVPTGLIIDPDTGIVSGTIEVGNSAGNYLIVIERYNTLGDTVSQSYTLALSPPAENTYQAWITTQNVGVLTGFQDDADGDGLANGIENFLGTPAAISNPGLSQVSSSPGILVFRHSRSNTPAVDISATYEWSADLAEWHPSAATSNGTTVTIGTETIVEASAPDNDLIEVTATVTGVSQNQIFLRIKSTQP